MSPSKKVKHRQKPKDRYIGQGGDPGQYYGYKPSWSFSGADRQRWSLFDAELDDLRDMLEKMRDLGAMTWDEIIKHSNNNHHYIEVSELNKCAVDRLTELRLDNDKILSLRLTGNHRLYGFVSRAVFNVLWLDLDHGDNDTCVCRSQLKHT